MADYLRESGVKWLWEKIKTLLSSKQDKLVSGTNIKTINGTSLLGSGDVVVVGGGTDKHGAAFPNGKNDKPYHKVASVSSAVSATLDTNISFYVSEYYKDTSCGILNISLRWNVNADKFYFSRIFWSLNVGIDVNDFVLGWAVANGVVTCNLYVKRTGWTSYALKRIDEQVWGNPKDLWQCYNATYPNNCYEAIPDANTVVSVNETIANTANTAKKLTTARTISLSGGASGSVSFDGSAGKDFFVGDLKEAYLSHGGKHITGNYSMLDGMATVEGWNNRLSFWPPELIQVEYTNNYTEDADGNENADVIWSDYFADFSSKDTNSIKTRLVTNGLTNSWLYTTGKSSIAAIANQSRLRVTFDIPASSYKYFVVRKALILVAQGSVSYNDYVIVEKVTRVDYKNGDIDKWTYVTQCNLAGDSGWNSLSIDVGSWGITDYSKIYRLRFTFVNGTSRSRHLTLGKIYAIGNTVYNLDNNLAKTGHLYTFDYQQNAIFPAAVTATKHVTQGGTSNQVVLANGNLMLISDLSPITDADADILLDNHIHNINVSANGNDVNISVIESSKNGNTWETEDNDIPIPLATTTNAGVMSKDDKTSLDNLINDGYIYPTNYLANWDGNNSIEIDDGLQIPLDNITSYNSDTEGLIFTVNIQTPSQHDGEDYIYLSLYDSDENELAYMEHLITDDDCYNGSLQLELKCPLVAITSGYIDLYNSTNEQINIANPTLKRYEVKNVRDISDKLLVKLGDINTILESIINS